MGVYVNYTFFLYLYPRPAPFAFVLVRTPIDSRSLCSLYHHQVLRLVFFYSYATTHLLPEGCFFSSFFLSGSSMMGGVCL